MGTNTESLDQPGQGKYLALVIGGLLVGAGVVALYYSFGAEGWQLNQDLAQSGFSGLDDIGALPASAYSLGLIAAGLVMMVALNATAWRNTGGY